MLGYFLVYGSKSETRAFSFNHKVRVMSLRTVKPPFSEVPDFVNLAWSQLIEVLLWSSMCCQKEKKQVENFFQEKGCMFSYLT